MVTSHTLWLYHTLCGYITHSMVISHTLWLHHTLYGYITLSMVTSHTLWLPHTLYGCLTHSMVTYGYITLSMVTSHSLWLHHTLSYRTWQVGEHIAIETISKTCAPATDYKVHVKMPRRNILFACIIYTYTDIESTSM